jgi:hypothetical protein
MQGMTNLRFFGLHVGEANILALARKTRGNLLGLRAHRRPARPKMQDDWHLSSISKRLHVCSSGGLQGTPYS